MGEGENEKVEALARELPDPEGASRFFHQLRERHPIEANRLLKNTARLSDILALASYSPLLGATILQNPTYIVWLNRRRTETKVRDKEELLEALARFSLTNTQIEPHVLMARFRRRELLRIYLEDIRGLGTIAEITTEISSLADAILEHSLRLARQEMDNRFGYPQEVDEKGRSGRAEFCVVSLGKLGSNELNYSSDIDLLFLYSSDGTTSGHGSRGAVTNREYFVKLAELFTRIVGQQSGEGAAYRVDMRLRPYGRVGALASSVDEAITYYRTKAQAWERQTLIRARSSAGEAGIFKLFYRNIETRVFSTDETVANALKNVRLSKEQINIQHATDRGFNVKLGRGGIREIEFIAQALQLAYGGADPWLRAPHTLISLSRLADRGLLSETELSALSDAYDFLRRLEHRLQMEHGLQTHLVSAEDGKRLIAARRLNFSNLEDFDRVLGSHIENVTRIFDRVFGDTENRLARTSASIEQPLSKSIETTNPDSRQPAKILQGVDTSLKKSKFGPALRGRKRAALERFCKVSPFFAEILTANPSLIGDLPEPDEPADDIDYQTPLFAAAAEGDLTDRLSNVRKTWSRLQLRIAAFDVFGKIDLTEAKRRQTILAENGIAAGLQIATHEIARLYDFDWGLHFAVLGLGKLGGRGMDYGSDLDLVLTYDDEKDLPAKGVSHAEFYARYVETFVSAVSGFTRDGNLYRIDLRLRPDGKNGPTSSGKTSFLNYLQQRSAIWEWLAYVKLRAAGGEMSLGSEIEEQAREIIHRRAQSTDRIDLAAETQRVRERLQNEKNRHQKDVDIKFGAGGMLDVYFAVRYLQLRDNIPDFGDVRSTIFTLDRLFGAGAITREDFDVFSEGYRFLGIVDHNLRLTVGRSTSLPLGNRAALEVIAERMNYISVDDLLAALTLHRVNIRQSYSNVFKTM